MSDPIYSIWHRVRAPFVMPQACHRCRMADWEVFDIDKAGCRVCGRFHQCSDGGDCVGVADSDHQACEITGCWIRTRNFQQGYTDTAMPMGIAAPAAKQWVESDHVLRWLHTLVFSDMARQCISREIQRLGDKASAAFARVAKSYKLEGRGPDMLEMFAQTRFVLGSLRIPSRITNQAAFNELADACVRAIMDFTGAFKRVLMPHVPPAKFDHFVIGLLYLLRTGVVAFDTLQVVPRIPALRRLLPMETSLKAQFHIPCKIITEVENITKIALKSLDRRKLKAMMACK
jgi:hypothetical protein